MEWEESQENTKSRRRVIDLISTNTTTSMKEETKSNIWLILYGLIFDNVMTFLRDKVYYHNLYTTKY